ncbi:hypothetical protein DFR24_3844 [Panacagrimonas perspica]|uniref:Uncharacterized protein n=1 Tax=Panacagrimonas perspica TaxID=381431 RepID=A0A4R7NZM8_9GAMM|nr:hypothetical protein DFR24_3844 [Panacagrimonas perspica]
MDEDERVRNKPERERKCLMNAPQAGSPRGNRHRSPDEVRVALWIEEKLPDFVRATVCVSATRR